MDAEGFSWDKEAFFKIKLLEADACFWSAKYLPLFLIENIFFKIKSRRTGVWLESISGHPVLLGFFDLPQFPQRFLVPCKNLLLISFGINFKNPLKSLSIIACAVVSDIIFICWISSILCKEQRMELVLEIQRLKIHYLKVYY